LFQLSLRIVARIENQPINKKWEIKEIEEDQKNSFQQRYGLQQTPKSYATGRECATKNIS